MAHIAPPNNDRKRVKVYELRSNDWFDRGTGFCIGTVENEEAKIYVHSEDAPDRVLLETRVGRDDGYQKQQDTLIVWTEPNGTDMALSFQEAEGCASIWDFVSEVQSRLANTGGQDDGLSDDVMENFNQIMLPDPELGNLPEIEQMIRQASVTGNGRDALGKFIINNQFITKLVPLVSMAEDLESLEDLHRLCNIMKTLILLNDTSIIEYAVTDEVIFGVVGALEYDPDFPSHKASHRQYLSDESKFKEVVRIEDQNVRKKIHYTYRLQYLKDVVLARIIDDPTFSLLNSMIYFNQVDIVQHLQTNAAFLKELFSVFGMQDASQARKRDAVQMISQCCGIAKNLQANLRAQLYNNFIGNGLFNVLTFALRNTDPAVRVAGTDILVNLIDHDPLMMRTHIFRAIGEKSKPLTDTLIELLLVETDLGVKSQLADAIKVLLDPAANAASIETLNRTNTDFLSKLRGANSAAPHTDTFIQNFYDESAKKLFQPLKELEGRQQMDNLTPQEVSLYAHLVDVLVYFLKQHAFRSKFFVLSEGLAARVAQLLGCPQKHLKLSALKYFRACIGLHDEYHNRQIITKNLFEPILNVVYETMPRDNLLNSACLELFEFIKRVTTIPHHERHRTDLQKLKENMKPLVIYLVENFREKLKDITYVDTFQGLITRYEQLQHPEPPPDMSFTTQESDANATPNRGIINGGQRWQGLKENDAEEEAYFNSIDEDEDESPGKKPAASKPTVNGASPVRSLVNYPDDDEDDMDILTTSPKTTVSSSPNTKTPTKKEGDISPASTPPTPTVPSTPPERLSEKRRREEDEEDELGKLSVQPKRRSSTSSTSSKSDAEKSEKGSGSFTRRKRNVSNAKDGTPKKIAFSIGVKAEGKVGDGGGE